MREPDGYRQTLAWLGEKAEGKGWLSTTEIARVLGVSRQTVVRRFGIHNGCALPMLAMKLTKESK